MAPCSLLFCQIFRVGWFCLCIGSAFVATSLHLAATDPKPSGESSLKQATFGGGCFWCTEAVFQRLEGVAKVVSGYSGGHVKNPTYQQVSGKHTGHAEVIQITYDPRKVEYKELLEVFWKTHDPTTRNKQGVDVGPQYRSVIFYHDDEQKALAELYKKKLNDSHYFPRAVVTEISPLRNFYPAELYHQNFFNLNRDNRYCQTIVASKVAKFREIFGNKAKSEAEVVNAP